MVDRLKQIGAALNRDRIETAHNTRRVKPNLPKIERKLDILANTHTFSMEFPLTGAPQSVLMNIQFKPDNCCDCEYGAVTQTRDIFATPLSYGPYGPSIVGETYSDGITHLATYSSPPSQSGSYFNYGGGGPWWHPLYQDYSATIAGYSLDGDGHIIIPTDGIYTITFRGIISGSAYDVGAELYASIQRLRVATDLVPNPSWDTLAQRKYSVNIGNLNLSNGSTYVSVCTALHANEKIAAAYRAVKIVNWKPAVGSQSESQSNQTLISLRGLGWGSLAGVIKDQYGNPVDGATVAYSNVGFGGSAVSDINGRYFFDQLVPAYYTLTASHTGYTPSTRDVRVYFDQTANLDFQLIL